MKLSWETITVGQFQDICEMGRDHDLDEMEKVERVISILYDLTPNEVDALSMKQFNECAKECAFVLSGEKIPGKPVKILKANGKRYAINYDITCLKHRQYVELMHFGKEPIKNMHLVMASVVQPVNWIGIRRKNDVEKHPSIAADLQEARLIDVYHTCVFFCKLYVSLINDIKDYLALTMTQTTGITMSQAYDLIQTSQNVMDGFIIQQK